MSRFLSGQRRRADRQSADPEPVEAAPEVRPYRRHVPPWGRRGTLWEWLVVLGVSAVFVVLFARTTFERAERFGAAAFPQWHWDVYDWKIWPLKYFRGGSYAPSWWP